MKSIIDYAFGKQKVCNHDGTLPVVYSNVQSYDAEGPGDFFGYSFPRSVFLGKEGTGKVDICKIKKDKISRFYMHVVFRFEHCFHGVSAIIESGYPPFKLNLVGDGMTVKLRAAVGSDGAGWTATRTNDTHNITPCAWHYAEVAFDIDTLSVIIDGCLVSTNALGCVDVFPSSKQYSNDLIIGGSNSCHHFGGNIACLKISLCIPPSLETMLDTCRSSAEWYITSKLGKTLDGGITYDTASQTWTYAYGSGAIMYNAGSSAAFNIRGAIYSKYLAISEGDRLTLGPLVSDESVSTDDVGRKSVFFGGAIYWSPATGAWPVTGQLYLDYENTGESLSWGFPVESAVLLAGGIYQRMQSCTWFHKEGSPSAHEVHGDILDAYNKLGGINSWGWPVTNEKSVLNWSTEARFSEFERCTFYWSAMTGAHEVHGDIRTVYFNHIIKLGLPTTDSIPIPGSFYYAVGFERGTICWLGSLQSTSVVFPFKIFLGTVNSKEREGAFQGQNDLYFRVVISVGGTTVLNQRYPSSGDYGGDNNRDFSIDFPPELVPDPSKDIVFSVDVWDSDDGAPFGGGDDHLGTWSKVLNAANAWGSKTNDGILDSGEFDYINNIRISVKPDVNIDLLTDAEKWWAVDNRGTDPLTYSQYSQAFRDVDSEKEWWDVGDHLKSVFFELVVRHIAKGGNCFGMSLEAIYAYKQAALESVPLNRFADPSDWETVRPQFNTKQQWQCGSAAIWYFLGQLSSGNTHNPVNVFRETREAFQAGQHPVICLAQTYWFGGTAHTVLPVKWNDSVTPWEITIFDPIHPSTESPPSLQTQTLKVYPGENKFTYNSSSPKFVFEGDRWSGSRLFYMPFTVLDEAPRTPFWEAIALILAGSIIIMGADSKTDAITDVAGNDISSHSSRATEALKQGMSLNGYFSNVPIQGIDGWGGEFLCSANITKKPTNEPPVIRLYSATMSTSDPVTPPVRKQAQNFVHRVVGYKEGGVLKHLSKHAGADVTVVSSIAKGENVIISAKEFGTQNARFSLVQEQGKDFKVRLSQRMGVSQDVIVVEFFLTSSAGGEIEFFPRLGLRIIDIFAKSFELTKGDVTVTKNGDSYKFNLGCMISKCNAFRLKFNPCPKKSSMVFAHLSAGQHTEVIGSEVITLTP